MNGRLAWLQCLPGAVSLFALPTAVCLAATLVAVPASAQQYGNRSAADVDPGLREALMRAVADSSSFTDRFEAEVWLTDMSTFGEMNAAWEAWLPAGQGPARATVESKLAAPQYKVEIGIIAAAG